MKNKRIALMATTIIMSIVMIFAMSGCSLLEIILGGSSGTISDDSIEITVYNDDIPATFKVKSGEENEITAYTKPGYYLVGYFSEKSGGTKYFDTEGKSVSIWQKTNPTTLYAQWKPNSQLETFNSGTLKTLESIELAWTNSQVLYHSLPAEYINAAKGSFEELFDITITFKLKSPSTTNFRAYICDNSNRDREYYDSAEFGVVSGNYIEYKLDFVVKAGAFRFGKLFFEIEPNIGLTQRAYLKEISLIVQYHQSSQDDVTE